MARAAASRRMEIVRTLVVAAVFLALLFVVPAAKADPPGYGATVTFGCGWGSFFAPGQIGAGPLTIVATPNGERLVVPRAFEGAWGCPK